MTDRDKIITLFELFTNTEVIESPNSFKAGDKRFFSNDGGEIVKLVYTDARGERRTALAEAVSLDDSPTVREVNERRGAV